MGLISSIRRSLGLAAGRYRKARRGSAAVEFALVAFPFFLFVMSIIEVGLIGLSSATLKNGVRETARAVRVGAAQSTSRDDLIRMICGGASFLPNCENRTELSQIVFNAWSGDLEAQADAFVNSQPAGSCGADFQAVSGGNIVMMQVTYRWSLISPIVTPFLGDANGEFPFRESFAFQAEQFTSSGATASASCPSSSSSGGSTGG